MSVSVHFSIRSAGFRGETEDGLFVGRDSRALRSGSMRSQMAVRISPGFRKGFEGMLEKAVVGSFKLQDVLVGLRAGEVRGRGTVVEAGQFLTPALGEEAAHLIRRRVRGGTGQMGLGSGRAGTQEGTQGFAPYSSRPLWLPATKTYREEPSSRARASWARMMQEDTKQSLRSKTSLVRRGKAHRGERRWLYFEQGWASLKGGSRPNLSVSGQMLADLRVVATYRERERQGAGLSFNANYLVGTYDFQAGFATVRSLRIALFQHFGTPPSKGGTDRRGRPMRGTGGIPARPFVFFTQADVHALSEQVSAELVKATTNPRYAPIRDEIGRLTGRFHTFTGHRPSVLGGARF